MGPTLLQATATGQYQQTGDLTAEDGVPEAVSGKPVKIAADWTTSAELTGEWPRPATPRPPLILAAVVLVAAAALVTTAAFLLIARRRRSGPRS